jgi:hypothetical protein
LEVWGCEKYFSLILFVLKLFSSPHFSRDLCSMVTDFFTLLGCLRCPIPSLLPEEMVDPLACNCCKEALGEGLLVLVEPLSCSGTSAAKHLLNLTSQMNWELYPRPFFATPIATPAGIVWKL